MKKLPRFIVIVAFMLPTLLTGIVRADEPGSPYYYPDAMNFLPGLVSEEFDSDLSYVVDYETLRKSKRAKYGFSIEQLRPKLEKILEAEEAAWDAFEKELPDRIRESPLVSNLASAEGARRWVMNLFEAEQDGVSFVLPKSPENYKGGALGEIPVLVQVDFMDPDQGLVRVILNPGDVVYASQLEDGSAIQGFLLEPGK